MELLDGPALECIAAYLGTETIEAAMGASGGAAFLLVQFDGLASETDAAAASELIRASGGTVRVSADAAEGERLLAIRRAFHPALAAQGTVLIEDVAVPRSRMPQMFAAIRAIGEKYDVAIPTVAHAGDGNLHPNFVYAGDDVPDRVWDAAGELFRTAIELGGTLTGEHGVGLLKRRWLADELGADAYELQVKLKSVFDPLGLMNPGKVFG
jgi:glycolate oxidase